MHFTPWPFWARIVSIATVVLPVLRSPMMSSRWPRPIGVMASMALMPVWSGSPTGWRPTMPGACTSRRRSWRVAIGPLPSIACPSELMTRPMSSSPTPIERMRPVPLTAPPSSILLASPRTTAPIDSSSRFRARPSVPPSNSSTSLTAVPGRPATRAMPSPTSSTRPICACSTEGWNVSTCLRSAAAISSALMVSSAISDLFLQLFESVTDRAVDDHVADAGDDAAHHRRVDDHPDLDVLVGRVRQRVAQALHLVGVQRDRGAHLGHDLAPFLGRQLHEAVDDLR